MTATIVLPLDGSEFSEAAMPVAGRLAQEMGARVVLLHVFQRPEAALRDETGAVIAYIDQIEADRRQDGLVYLRGIAAKLMEHYKVADVAIDVRPGEPVPTVVEAAEDADAVLIVMATHGRTGLARVLLGSVAGTVLRRSRIPVTLVRPAMVETEAEEGLLVAAK